VDSHTGVVWSRIEGSYIRLRVLILKIDCQWDMGTWVDLCSWVDREGDDWYLWTFQKQLNDSGVGRYSGWSL
jgi:hypothetical protein